jgi:arylsulfatase A-like enzyme
MLPAIRSEAERDNAHPVFAAYMDMRYSKNMSRDEARAKVIPTYMGLITQIDDQMGVLMAFLESRGVLDTTMIVFTSDHGDYLGDHWMGEKGLFHDQSAKIPLIVIDPSRAADATRGTQCDALVEAIDLAPTFVDYFGGKPPACSWCSTAAGNTSTLPASARCCTTWRAIRRNWSIAATMRHARRSSRGCRPSCSTGRCTPTITSRPATKRSPPMPRTSSRSKPAS